MLEKLLDSWRASLSVWPEISVIVILLRMATRYPTTSTLLFTGLGIITTFNVLESRMLKLKITD